MKIIAIDKNQRQTEINAHAGLSLMEVSFQQKVSGILAECGGACACATCHVYIEPEWLSKLSPMDEMEDVMLDVTLDRRSNSRLACQIKLTESLDGLIFTVADNSL